MKTISMKGVVILLTTFVVSSVYADSTEVNLSYHRFVTNSRLIEEELTIDESKFLMEAVKFMEEDGREIAQSKEYDSDSTNMGTDMENHQNSRRVVPDLIGIDTSMYNNTDSNDYTLIKFKAGDANVKIFSVDKSNPYIINIFSVEW